MTELAEALAGWAIAFEPTDDDLALAELSLRDTVAVIYAARAHPLRQLFAELGDAGRLAALAHVLDFDDLHMPSTTHVSAVCVPAALEHGSGREGDAGRSEGGGDPARAYLAGAGVMARLGQALGWRHYAAGWHATCTAGAPAAAVASAVAAGLDANRIATAIALAVPGAGGVQRAFGTAAKALQVGFAVDAGVRAARLARAGATADLGALDQWMELVDADRSAIETTDNGPAVPGGLAIKLHPCCYALQRPISAMRELGPVDVDAVRRIHVSTPAASLRPLIHRRPETGLQAKFSLEYGLAATVLDRWPDIDSFGDEAVRRPEARELMERVETTATAGGGGLLDGQVTLELELDGGETRSTTLEVPPGAPDRPPTDEELRRKIEACAGESADEIASLTWASAQQLEITRAPP